MHLHHDGGSVRGASALSGSPEKMCPSGGMVDALDSKSCSERSARSSRAWGTTKSPDIADCGFFDRETNAFGSTALLEFDHDPPHKSWRD